MDWMFLPVIIISRRSKCSLVSHPENRHCSVSHAHSLFSLERQRSVGKDMPKQYVLSQA